MQIYTNQVENVTFTTQTQRIERNIERNICKRCIKSVKSHSYDNNSINVDTILLILVGRSYNSYQAETFSQKRMQRCMIMIYTLFL